MSELVAVPDPSSGSMLDGMRAVRAVLAPDLNDAELMLFAMVAQRSGLDPFAKQIYAIKRKGRLGFQVGIDGLRSIAARTGEYDGQDAPVFGPDCSCKTLLYKHPEVCTVNVYRKGISRPFPGQAYWHEYLPGEGQDFQWRKMPHVMLAKVAEALALRKGFPWDPSTNTGIGGDIYTEDEMAQAGPPPPSSLSDRVAARAGGISVAEFRESTKGIEADEIVRVAHDLFPDARKFSDLSAVERVSLRDRLLEDAVAPVIGERSDDVAGDGEAGTPSMRRTDEGEGEDPLPEA